MPALELAQNHPRRNVRLNTLVRLRWLAITGQTVAVLGVLAGGLTSPTYAIEIAFPPRVTRIDLEYAYPADAHVRPWTEAFTTGDIYGPRDTQVRVHVYTDKPVDTGELMLENQATFPLTLDTATKLTVVLRVEGDNAYRIALAGTDGLTSTDDSSHLIRVTK